MIRVVEVPQPGDSVNRWFSRMSRSELSAVALMATEMLCERIANDYPDIPNLEKRPPTPNHVMVLWLSYPGEREGRAYHYTGTLTIEDEMSEEGIDYISKMLQGEIVHNPILSRAYHHGSVRFAVHPFNQEKQTWPRQ